MRYLNCACPKTMTNIAADRLYEFESQRVAPAAITDRTMSQVSQNRFLGSPWHRSWHNP